LPGDGNTGGKPEGKAPRAVPDRFKATYVVYEPDKKAEEKNATSVSGKVTYKGLPLPAWTISLKPKDGAAFLSAIGEDGSYKLTDVPPGEYAVTVETDSVKPPARFVKLPKKYAGPETSGLKYTVVKGKQTFDIVLND